MDLNEIRNLEIYYTINVNKDMDISLIEKCLKLHLEVNLKNYTIKKFVNCSELNVSIDNENQIQTDVIKNGLLTFNNMYDRLKLKTTDEVWFIYLTNGNIKEIYRDVFVMLLNKNPSNKVGNYIISKKKLDINLNYDKQQKLDALKLMNMCLSELSITDKSINYTNLN